MNFTAIISGVFIFILGSLIVGATGLLISRGPLRAHNQLLRLWIQDYKDAAEAHNQQKLELEAALEETHKHLAIAETRIAELTKTITDMAVENTALRDRLGKLEATVKSRRRGLLN